MKVAVVGAGSWGTVAAALAARSADTIVWARRTELAEAINANNENPDYLPGHQLPNALRATADLGEAMSDADLVMMVVPSHGFRAVLEAAKQDIPPTTPIVSLSKGIEQESMLRMTQVTSDVLPDHPRERIGVLTGPNLAKEIAAGQPAATVVAFADEPTARIVQELLMGPTFRVYTNPDVVGCESAGALKNVMAIAAGMASGLGYGDNTLATLVTRALAELTRLGVVLGGNPLTFAGLAGMGDLIATCVSTQSRNHRVGHGLGTGKTLDEITSEMNMVAEGVKTTRAVLSIAAQHGVEMPIATQVGRVLYEGAAPAEAVRALMSRQAKAELHGIG